MIVLVVVGVRSLRSLMVVRTVGWIDDKSCILIGRSKYLKVQILTFEMQILGNICIQIGNICTFTYLYVIFGCRKMTFCKYHMHIFRIFDICMVVSSRLIKSETILPTNAN
jgi:hypothetical protein